MDDPYKTIVGDDGGLYYEYGKQGPEDYHNGQGSFGTRVWAGFVGNAQGGPLQQSLYNPRVPIVISERAYGQWLVRQQAWSNPMRGTGVAPTDADRVDYLTVSACNQGASADAGQITLDVGSNKRLVLDQSRLHLLIDGRADQVFCQFSVPCEPLASDRQGDAAEKPPIRADAAARVQKNWAQPKGECASCFQHVLVGFGQPLVFRVDVEPGSARQIVLGLIEGWHAEPGKRPLRLAVEGAPEQRVDLVREHGRNTPVAIAFAAKDSDRDGTLLVQVLPVPGAEDGNTILSALWVFPAGMAVGTQDVVAGRLDAKSLARMDADAPPVMPHPLRLAWNTGQVNAGESFELFVALPQGDNARRQLTLDDKTAELQRCIEYWQQVDLPYDRFAVPDRAVQNLLDSCIRNIYQARERKNGQPKFQVGPTCYRARGRRTARSCWRRSVIWGGWTKRGQVSNSRSTAMTVRAAWSFPRRAACVSG